ncbi:MAG: toxin-antitoxin system TumE family protein [bacterium]
MFFDSNNNLIFGWDNAPHHKNIETYPHHKHEKVQENILNSDVRNIKDVLNKLTDYFNKL